ETSTAFRDVTLSPRPKIAMSSSIISTCLSVGACTAVTVYLPEERPSAENQKDWLDPLLASTTFVWNVRTALPAESARVTVSVSSKTTASMSLPRSTSPAIERLDPCDVADNLAIQYPRVPIDSSSKSAAGE